MFDSKSPYRVWDVHSGQVINELHHKAAVSSLKLKTDTLVTGCAVSGKICIKLLLLPICVYYNIIGKCRDYRVSVSYGMCVID